MMIKKLKYGNTNTYYIGSEEEGILIDTDWAGTLPLFYKAIKEEKIKFTSIKYIIATHYHPDHIGLVSILMDLGIKLIILQEQVDYIHYSDKIFSKTPNLKYKPIDKNKAIILTCKESRAFLKTINIEGEIIHTAGHSPDSITIILDNKIAIVGDLDPLDNMTAFPSTDPRHESWNKILAHSPTHIYYSHFNEQILK